MFKLTLGDGFDRVSFAGARNGDLPTVLAFINVKFFTPMTSLVLQVTRHDTQLSLPLSVGPMVRLCHTATVRF